MERRRRRKMWRKRSIFTFRLISGRRPHTQASKTGKIWQDAVSWDEEGLQSSDQRINQVGMDHERSNTERMRGFGAIALEMLNLALGFGPTRVLLAKS